MLQYARAELSGQSADAGDPRGGQRGRGLFTVRFTVRVSPTCAAVVPDSYPISTHLTKLGRLKSASVRRCGAGFNARGIGGRRNGGASGSGAHVAGSKRDASDRDACDGSTDLQAIDGGIHGKVPRVEYARRYPEREIEPERRAEATGPDRPKRKRVDGRACYSTRTREKEGAKRRCDATGRPPGRPPG